MFEDLKGRTAVVFGVANKRSIAWAIAQGLHAAGMNLAITYQNERLEQEAKDLILSLPGAEAFMCDVSNDAAIAGLFETLKAALRQAARARAQRGFRSGGRTEGRLREHDTRRLPHRARRQRVFADRGFAGRRRR